MTAVSKKSYARPKEDKKLKLLPNYNGRAELLHVGKAKELRKRIRCIMMLADFDREYGMPTCDEENETWMFMKPPNTHSTHYHVHEQWDGPTLVYAGSGNWVTSDEAAQDGCVLESCDMCKQIAVRRYGFCEKHHHST